MSATAADTDRVESFGLGDSFHLVKSENIGKKRQDILKLHRLADQWDELRHRVRTFLNQFAYDSPALLHYVGLLGDGLLAKTIRLA